MLEKLERDETIRHRLGAVEARPKIHTRHDLTDAILQMKRRRDEARILMAQIDEIANVVPLFSETEDIEMRCVERCIGAIPVIRIE